jgi:galactokinase
MNDIVELQHKLMEAQGKILPTKYRARTAAVDDAAKLIKAGYSTGDISDFLGISVDVIESERNRIQEDNQRRRKFLQTGDIGDNPNALAHFPIYQR